MLFLQSTHSFLCSALRTQASTLRYGGLSLVRSRHQLAPRKVTFIKRHTGVIPIPTGGSTKGTTLSYGDWGLRIKGKGVRITAKQLTTAEEVIKRKIKPIKGARVYMRVFPHLPVCVKVYVVFNEAFTGFLLTRFREMRLVWERERVHSNIGQHGMPSGSASVKLDVFMAFF
jgi:ribosomal protein L16/L10AE